MKETSERPIIVHADILQTEAIAPSSVDLIVTSPPYNLSMAYSSSDDSLTYTEYLEWTRRWLLACRHLLRDDGRMCVNIPLDKSKGGYQSVGADITVLAKEVGFRYRCSIVWNEGTISRRTAWGSWLSASAPHIIAPVELIIVLFKNHWKKTSGSHQSDISREEFMAWTNGLWTFPGESRKRIGHPAPFPLELPTRCIKLFSFVGDTVLDPFMGSGTTLIAAYNSRRRGIGVDISEEYCKLAKKRIESNPQVHESRMEA